MRHFHIFNNIISEDESLLKEQISQGFHWLSFTRREFEVHLTDIQTMLDKIYQLQVLDLHISDILNNQLPSHYDYTSEYDIIVFRRLARGRTESDLSNPGQILHVESSKGGPPILKRIDTSPISFLIFDRLIISVHPADCSVRELFASRLLNIASTLSVAHNSSRLPNNSVELMLRMIGLVVDGYLDLRKELTRQLDHWQSELINPNARFNNWSALLDSRLTLHYLDEICEDQRAAIQDWINALDSWRETDSLSGKDLELVRVRSRDVLEHIERVVHHVNRLEQSAETAVQMHFNIQSNHNNDVMKTLTALTAIFLPLNLITGYFGMNFENFPFIKTEDGLFYTEIFMALLALVLVVYFWVMRLFSSNLKKNSL
ncbi:MAG: magnesium transporter CorA [Betaproteobacteria bacterium]|nr:magnesium transporter CorA [Betaproteobacteria bacterium]